MCRQGDLAQVLTRWQHQLYSEYEFLEPILLQRVTMMQLACSKMTDDVVPLRGHYLALESLAKSARKAHRYQVVNHEFIHIHIPCILYSVCAYIPQYHFTSIVVFYIYLIQYQPINDGVAIEWRQLVISTVFVRSLFITVFNNH